MSVLKLITKLYFAPMLGIVIFAVIQSIINNGEVSRGYITGKYEITILIGLVLFLCVVGIELVFGEIFISASAIPLLKIVNQRRFIVFYPKFIIFIFFYFYIQYFQSDSILPSRILSNPITFFWIFFLALNFFVPLLSILTSHKAHCHYCKTTYKVSLTDFFRKILFRPANRICPSCGKPHLDWLSESVYIGERLNPDILTKVQ